jgi:predicted Fe-Mo cluster-binding NifX family protein
VITGNIGSNAYQVLSAAGIKVVTRAMGTVKEIVERYELG